MNNLNPYASPGVDAKLLPPEPEVSGAWRDGDTLLLRRKGAVLPRACLRTNQTTTFMRYEVHTFSSLWDGLIVVLLVVPFVGFCVASLAVLLLVWFGLGAQTKLPVRRRLAPIVVLQAIATTALLVGGNLSTGVGLADGKFHLSVIGFACSLVGVVLAFASERVLFRLRFKLVAPDLVRVQGVHPDYLKRLPEFEGSEITEPFDISRAPYE